MSIEVSIIMPVYNTEAFLAESIESVLAQTYREWELLIVDDGSTDGSVFLIKAFTERDPRIKYLKMDIHSGSPALPRNIGIKYAQGRYIAFIDSDDMWLPDKLEKQVELFGDPRAAVVYCDYERIAEDGRRAGRIVRAPGLIGYGQLLLGNVIGGLTGVYDTHKVGKVYQLSHPHEDYIMWLSILKRGFVARSTQTVGALHRVRRRSVSSNKLKALSWQWDIYRHVEKLGLVKSVYCFMHYAYKAFKKNRK